MPHEFKANGKMEISSTYQEISPLDALWALYHSQSKRVRKAFLLRVQNEELDDREEKRMKTYERTLSDKEIEAAHQMAETIKEGVKEVREATQRGTHVGRNADDFLAELMEEQP